MKPVYACTRSWSFRPDDLSIKKREEGKILSQHADDVFDDGWREGSVLEVFGKVLEKKL